MEAARGILQSHKLAKMIEGTSILTDIDLKIESGQMVFLIGPSGSGKTTLLRCLAGIENINGGEIRFKDKVISSPNHNIYTTLYPQITAVTQDYTLWPHLTNLGNITLSKYSLPSETIETYAAKLNIADLLSKYPYECSGGEQQRIALLRHIALQPQILLLDEITSALDIEQVTVLIDLLSELRKQGLGILVITHLITLVATFAEDEKASYYFLDAGKIVEKNHCKYLLNPKTERLKKFLSGYAIS